MLKYGFILRRYSNVTHWHPAAVGGGAPRDDGGGGGRPAKARERFGRASKTLIICDVSYQTL